MSHHGEYYPKLYIKMNLHQKCQKIILCPEFLKLHAKVKQNMFTKINMDSGKHLIEALPSTFCVCPSVPN